MAPVVFNSCATKIFFRQEYNGTRVHKENKEAIKALTMNKGTRGDLRDKFSEFLIVNRSFKTVARLPLTPFLYEITNTEQDEKEAREEFFEQMIPFFGSYQKSFDHFVGRVY
jgi:hypothetical protein